MTAVSERDRDMLARRYSLPAVEAIETGVDLDFFAMSPAEAAPDPGTDGGVIVFTATMSLRMPSVNASMACSRVCPPFSKPLSNSPVDEEMTSTPTSACDAPAIMAGT